MGYSEQCSSEIKEKSNVMEDLNNAGEMLKMERERLKNQEIILKEEIEKEKFGQKNLEKSIENVRGKIYNIQSYIRDLSHEENKTGETLTLLEDENNSIDLINEDLEALLQSNVQEKREFREQI